MPGASGPPVMMAMRPAGGQLLLRRGPARVLNRLSESRKLLPAQRQRLLEVALLDLDVDLTALLDHFGQRRRTRARC